jgi:NAD(P)-dependent dehydrogenase (short-subunit alcohol dehydrogenase family)
MEFDHQVAIVTGGTGALGSSVALDLLASGASTAVTYRRDEEWARFEGLAKGHQGRLAGIKADLLAVSEAERMVAGVLSKWKRVDFLVAAAGGFAAGKSYETAEETWDLMFNVNLRSLFTCLRAVVPVMLRQNSGRIVTVSSGAILRGGGAGIAAYALSKGSVRQLTKILASELKGSDVRVHCVIPGTMDTEANRRAMPKADFSKWVKTEDVARAIHFLLSDASRSLRSVALPVLG